MAGGLRLGRTTVLFLLVLAPTLSGCLRGPPGEEGSPPVPAPAPVLPPGTTMEGAEILDQTPSEIRFRWKGPMQSTYLRNNNVVRDAEAKLTLPAGAVLEVVAEQHEVPGVDLETRLLDPARIGRCVGEGPGLRPEPREVCRERPVGPFAAPSTWTVRVQSKAADGDVRFVVDVTVRALPDAPVAALGQVLPFEAAAKDGVKLRGHVYLPEGPGPFATVLVFMPYWNHGGSVRSDQLAITLDGRRTMRAYSFFLEAGFAFAAVNTRGSGISDGCYEYMNHPKNGPDANAVVDALAAQPWSNGRVGMYGVSYPGATQFAAIASDPSPHLRAVVPMSGEWDEWNFLAIWGAAYDGAGTHPTWRNVHQGLGAAAALEEAEDARVSPLTPQHWCQDTAMSPWNWDQLIVNGDKNGWFRARDLREGIERSRVPFFMTNGLTDGEGSHRSTPYDLWDLVHAPQRWMLAQSGHGAPGKDALAFAWESAIPWFDHYLRDGPAIASGFVDYQDDARRWHRAERWPPAGTRTELFLSDGMLVADRGSVRASEQRVVNRDRVNATVSDCGVAAVYVSEPLERETLIAGEFRVNLTVSPTAPNGNVAVFLYRTKGLPACGSAASPGDPTSLLRFGLSDLRHRGHLEQGTDATPGIPLTMSMRSYPLAARVPAGERLVLVIGAGHPELTPKPYQPVLTVLTGPQIEGKLVLNVVDESGEP